MADDVITDFGAVRYLDLMSRMGEVTAEEKAYMMKQFENDLNTALQMPMFKKLPDDGFKYDWKQFHIRNGGLFLIQPSRVGQHFQVFNDHVKHFSSQEMDAFCAEVFHRATERLGKAAAVTWDVKWDELWARVPQEAGIKVPANSAANLAFWDWAMKIIAARFVWRQDASLEKHKSIKASDDAGDTDMLDQSNTNVPDTKPHSLTAEAVDEFLSAGHLKYGGLFRRKCFFGSHIGVGGPKWLGFTIRLQPPKPISEPRPVLSKPQKTAVDAQGSNDQAGSVDELVVGMHGTAIEEGGPARPVFANLAFRPVKPSKRSYDDSEESEATKTVEQPLAKIAKASQGQTNTSGSPKQLDQH